MPDPIVFEELVVESTASNSTGDGVVLLPAVLASGYEASGDHGVAVLPALQSEGTVDDIEIPTATDGVATLPLLATVGAGGLNLYGDGIVELPPLGLSGFEVAGDHGLVVLPALRADGFDLYDLPTGYINATPRPVMSVLASFATGLSSGVTFTEEFDFEMLFALYSSVQFDDRLTALANMLMELEDNFQLREAVRFVIEAQLNDTVEFTDASTITAEALLAITSAIVFTDDTDAHINALLAIASAFLVADRVRAGLDIALTSTADFADLLSGNIDALMSLVSEAQLLDEVTGTMSVIMFASSDVNFDDEASGLIAMLMSLEDNVQMAVRFRTPDGESYAGYLVNIRNAAVSRLTHHNFNSMASIGGKLYAAGEEGIYVTGGDDFDGAQINAFVRTGLTDFGSSELKRMAESYVGYTSDGQLVLKVTTTDGGRKKENWYSLRARSADSPVEGRFEPARGLTARYWGFEIGNIDGADFQLDDLRVFPLTTIKRRKSGR